ncbi:hypothetical protein, partial [Salmonella enterica]|uniref:hypothetical protein n=1 Tax=Salmonella enterica TaxID=28901 RepID=UPI0038BBEE34
KTLNQAGDVAVSTGILEPHQKGVAGQAAAFMPCGRGRRVVGGLKGKIFIQRGGHDELSGNKKTAVGYRKAHFLSLTKTILRLVTGN